MSEDISFYTSNNPASSPRPCPISPCRDDMSPLSPSSSPTLFMTENARLPRLLSHDSSSMDSGYSGLQQDISNSRISASSTSSFQFIEPKRPETSTSSSSPPTRCTPPKYSPNSSANSRQGFTVFHSLSSGSGESIDDDYMELMDMESLDDDAQMPTDISSLISKDIKSANRSPDLKSESFVRKRLNMDESAKNSLFRSPSTPKTSTITSLITTPERQCLQNISENVTPFGYRNISTGAFKRPEPPAISPIHSKRYKCENEPPATAAIMQFPHPPFPPKRPVFRKSMSMNDANIMSALSRSSSEPNLIGDFSRPFCLPLIEGKHTDLKSISSGTMRSLLSGEFNENIASFKVIDCRYPYEYEGGHISGAVNLYTQEQILVELMTKKTEPNADGSKRHILVFHCEFSSERGPKL